QRKESHMATGTTVGKSPPPIASLPPAASSLGPAKTAAIRRMDAPAPAGPSTSRSGLAAPSASTPSTPSMPLSPTPVTQAMAAPPRTRAPPAPAAAWTSPSAIRGADPAVLLTSGATRRLITITVVLGFAALLVAGFGTALGSEGQALVLYVYLSLLLL